MHKKLSRSHFLTLGNNGKLLTKKPSHLFFSGETKADGMLQADLTAKGEKLESLERQFAAIALKS